MFEILKRNIYVRICLYLLVAVIAGGAILFARTHKSSPKVPPVTREMTEMAAEAGDKMAQRQMGVMYDFGQYQTPKNPAKAAYWYRKAAEHDEELSEYNLGTAYMTGRGVQVDYAEAIKWLRKAAEHGRRGAYTNLGKMYANGWGVPRDYEEAVRLWRKAAERKEPNAELNLGLAYRDGIGVPKNLIEAETWFRAAALQDLPDAQIYLAYAYATGQGIEQNKTEALKWLEKAATHIHFAVNLNDLIDSWIANPAPTVEAKNTNVKTEAVAQNLTKRLSQTAEHGTTANNNSSAGTKIKPKRIRKFTVRKSLDHQVAGVDGVSGDIFRVVDLGSGRWRIYERVSAVSDRMAGTIVRVRTVKSSKPPSISK